MSILLTVHARSAALGEVVGHAQVVDTGDVVALRSSDDLLALLRRLAGDVSALPG